MRALLRPTLMRRVSLTVLAAFALVWLVLLAFLYRESTKNSEVDGFQRNRGEILLSVMAKIADAEQARFAISLYSDLIQESYKRTGVPDQFFVQLNDRQGRRLYISPNAGDANLRGDPNQLIDIPWHGGLLHVYRGDTPRWTVLIGEKQREKAMMLSRISGEMAIYILIACPLVLVPVWFAVTRGLRPLRHLSNTIAARGPDDLEPLNVDAKYGELIPVTTAIDRLLIQLRTKMQRERAFVQDAAHEMRTPMAVIAAQAHVLVMAEGPEQQRAAGERLEHAIARASHLVQQLLDLAHIDNAAPAEEKVQDLAQLLRKELAGVAPAAMARNIELSLEAPDALPRALDTHAFQSVVQNLVSNALRYVHEGGAVVVELSAPAGALLLSVTDNGPGIAEAERALVFERFYRVAGSDTVGTGLGLAIVARAVERLHGTIRLDVGLAGRGCRFTVALPQGKTWAN
ncbi:sensor histidine kinase [Duganella sp. BJB475]|nr:sensor histidine kinase [Duganella sp. BJB475]RFP32629.1 sensor histidine kinase [Duganella sp. BJB476]